MIDDIKKNVAAELGIAKEMASHIGTLSTAEVGESEMIESTIESLVSSIRMMNNSLPSLLNSVSLAKELPSEREPVVVGRGLEKVSVDMNGSKIEAVVKKKDRKEFLEKLRINEELIKKIKKKKVVEEEKKEEFKAARGYLKQSNKFFLGTATNLINKGYFNSLGIDIKKSNIDSLFQSYVAMMLFTTAISFIVSLFLTFFFLFFDIGLAFPIITPYQGSYLSRMLLVVWIPIAIPLATFFALYIYPSSEKKSLSKKIEQELPFATIYMSSISGSGIEPTQIFRIIATSKEYPFLRKEIRKVINQINLYGYDLVTALNNVSKSTPSNKLSELFAGLSTTISSGGDLAEFFNKRAETLLIEYRLDREKYTKIAETFMDIYISVVIAAPMILMLLIVMISISGINIGFSTTTLNLVIIFIIALINIVFLTILHIKQPGY